MRFYVIFTLVFLFMLSVSLLQVRRQSGLAHRHFGLALVLGLLVSLLLVSTRLMPESWPMALAKPVWWAGYGVFGLVAYFFLYQAILFCLEMPARLVWPALGRALSSPRAMQAVTALTLATVAFGVYEGGDVRVLTREVATPKVRQRLRLVVASDIHLGALTLDSRLESLARLIEAQKPDALLLAGDIVNDHPEALQPFAQRLREIRPRLGSFGIFGNHERYEGDARSAQVFQWAGAELLRGRAVSLPEGGVQILGVDDPGRAGDMSGEIGREIRETAAASDPALFRVLMNHRPLAWDEAARPLGIELMVSGHTHRGQLFPFYLVVQMFNPYMGGFYEKGGQLLAVSGGAGFWGPPLRVLAPPDILVIDLVPAGAAGQ